MKDYNNIYFFKLHSVSAAIRLFRKKSHTIKTNTNGKDIKTHFLFSFNRQLQHYKRQLSPLCVYFVQIQNFMSYIFLNIDLASSKGKHRSELSRILYRQKLRTPLQQYLFRVLLKRLKEDTNCIWLKTFFRRIFNFIPTHRLQHLLVIFNKQLAARMIVYRMNLLIYKSKSAFTYSIAVRGISFSLWDLQYEVLWAWGQ